MPALTAVTQGKNALENAAIGAIGGLPNDPDYRPEHAIDFALAQVIGATVNVRSLGALGDGKADDTFAFNLAVAALPAGGEIIVPPGTYLIDPDANGGKSIRLGSGQTLRMSKGTVLQAKTNGLALSAVIYCLGISDFEIIGGTIVGDRATHAGTPATDVGFGVLMRSSTRGTVRGTYIRDTQGDGIYAGSPTTIAGTESTDILIEGATLDNNRRQGISFAAAKRCRVVGCSFINTNGNPPSAGIDFEANVGAAVVEDCVATGCVFENNTIGVQLSNCQQCSVTASIFRGNTTQAIIVSSAIDAVVADNQISHNVAADTALYLAFALGASVTNNTIRGTFLNGIWARGGGNYATVGRHRISGNKIFGDGATANQIGINVTNQAGRNTITQNQIYNCGGDGCSVSSSDYQTIAENTLSANLGNGLKIGTTKFVRGSGNISEGNTLAGITIGSTSQYDQINDNIVQGNGTFGIIISDNPTTDVVVDGNVVQGNSQTTNNTSDNISIAGTRNTARNNTVRQGDGANKARHGIIVAGGTDNRLHMNDAETGGASSEIRDIGATTRQFGDRTTRQISADRGDANVAITRGDVDTQLFNTPLTANRTVTLPTFGNLTHSGRVWRFVRTAAATGAFNLTVQDSGAGLIKVLGIGQWVEVQVNQANGAWIIVGFGNL